MDLSLICGEDPDWQKVLDLACYHKDLNNAAYSGGLLWMHRNKAWPYLDDEAAPERSWRFYCSEIWVGGIPHFIPAGLYGDGPGAVFFPSCRSAIASLLLQICHSKRRGSRLPER